jgi:hypothetical protein
MNGLANKIRKSNWRADYFYSKNTNAKKALVRAWKKKVKTELNKILD